MWCQVVKWFPQCLLYKTVIKDPYWSFSVALFICPSHVWETVVPVDGSYTPARTELLGSQRQENRRKHIWLFSFSLAHQWAHLSRKESAQICRSSRDQSPEDSSIYPTVCQAGGVRFCHVALSPRVTWLRFLHEHFFYHHIGIKSHNAQWHKWRNTLGGGGAVRSVKRRRVSDRWGCKE